MAVDITQTELISYYRHEESSGTHVDERSNLNPLTNTNSVGSTTALHGDGADFAGTNQVLSITNAAQTDLTIGDNAREHSLAVRFDNLGSSGYDNIVGKWISAGNNREYVLSVNLTTNRLELFASSDGAGGGSITTVLSAETLVQGNWASVFFWHDPDANELGIRVNDETPVTSSFSGGVYEGTAPFEVGALDGGSSGPINAVVDEHGVWDRILGEDNRDWIHNSGAWRAYSEIQGLDATTPLPQLFRRRNRR